MARELKTYIRELQQVLKDRGNIMVPDGEFAFLVGHSEIADMLGISASRATALSHSPRFPEPVVRLRMGPIWHRDHILLWQHERVRLGHVRPAVEK